MRYLVNADDFGKTNSSTEAIDQAIQNDGIHRTSLMVNTSATEKAIALAKAGGYASKVCFHLNLASEKPFTDAIKTTALCDSTGSFCRASNKRIQRTCFSKKAIIAIREECEAQMRFFREQNFQSNHIDSHYWCMYNLPVWIAIRPLIKKYGFKTTRSMNGFLRNSAGRKLKAYYSIVATAIRCSGIRFSEQWAGRPEGFIHGKGVLKKDVKKTAEVYIHPEMIDGIATDIAFSYNWEKKPVAEEMKLLASCATAVAIETSNQ